MGSDFKAPSLYIPQRQLLSKQVLSQGGNDTTTMRLEALILFWGTRSINSTVVHQRRRVGGLSQEVFQAFNIPFIEGVVISSGSTSNPPPNNLIDAQTPPLQTGENGNNKIPTSTPVAPQILGRYTEDISNWSNGAKLRNYEKLRELLVGFIETAIDWEIYGINKAQVKDRIRESRMAFDDQIGKIINSNDCLVFKRSMSVATMLQALDYLNVHSKNPVPNKIGDHMTILSNWLTENEAKIVAFAQRPTAQSHEKRSLISITLENCVLLSCLQGTYEHKSYSARELLSLVLTDCVRSTDKQWQNAIAQSEQYRSKKWASLMTGVVRKDNYTSVSRKSILQLLNCPQGGASSVRFIDADLALDILEKFEKNNWNLSSMEPVGNSASKEWITNYEINQAFITHFGATLQDECTLVTDKFNALQELVGNSDPKEVFAQIQNWIDTMKQLQKPYQLEVKSTINAQRLTRTLSSLEMVSRENRTKALALRLSGIVSTQKEATEHLQFLQNFKNEVSKQLAQLQQRFDQNSGRNSPKYASCAGREDIPRSRNYYDSYHSRESGGSIMTIAVLAESAYTLLKSIDNLEQNKLNAVNIEDTYTVLKTVKEVAQNIRDLCKLYYNRLPIQDIKQTELPKILKELQLSQAQFATEQQRRQVQELRTISARLNKVKTKIEIEWKNYAEARLLPYFDLHEIVKSLPEVRDQASTLNGLRNQLRHDISVLPLTQNDLSAFDRCFEQYKQRLSTLAHLHPEVRNFLQKANNGTATLADVTDEVLRWCRQGEHAKAFRIQFSY